MKKTDLTKIKEPGIWRGKTRSTEKWVYGWLHRNTTGTPIIRQTPGGHEYPVLEKTLTQFTTMWDEDGQAIFEGDIVQTGEGLQAAVEWDGGSSDDSILMGWALNDPTTHRRKYGETWTGSPLWVIGNIFDGVKE